ncbi:MAG: hypothetical protein M3Q42_06295 [Pseudomonadota bacterium]|nr:hypothetical protein [Pseudomonadota bacterium]
MNALVFLGKSIGAGVVQQMSRACGRVEILAAENLCIPELPNVNVHRYPNFHDNGMVELDALRIGRSLGDLQVFGVSEGDVLRVAALNDVLDTSGMRYQQALQFRDKIRMKGAAEAGGISVPAYSSVAVPFDLVRFVDLHGYPLVIKPVSGSGGSGTTILRDVGDLERVLTSSQFSYKEIAATHIVETFVEGDMYHVDGLVIDGKVELPFVSRYYNSCLSFQTGQNVGGYMLEAVNPLRARMLDVMDDVAVSFSFAATSAFHLEVFHTPADELVFCEIACRAGGGAIMETFTTVCGFRYDELAVLGTLDRRLLATAFEQYRNVTRLGGYLMVPPQRGCLRRFPEALPFEWVEHYMPNARVGERYHIGSKVADNILQAIVAGDSESSVASRLLELESWLSHEIEWELEDE